MRNERALTIAIAVLLCGASVHAQTFPAATRRSFGELKAVVAQAEAAESQQVQLQWFTSVGDAAVVRAADAQLLRRVRGVGPLPAERDPQLSTDHLVVVSSDAAGREIDWRLVLDPRLIRAEVPDDQGRLTGRLLQRTEANLLVEIPDGLDIVRVRVYAPEWTSGGFLLRLVATADLP